MADAQLNFGDGSAQAPATFGTPVSHVYASAGSYGISATAPTGERGTTRVSGPGTYDVTVTVAGAAVPATGAIAGTPGTFTPAGATVPANLAAMATIVASPNTAWTTGQNVVTADTNATHWDGAAWTAGVTP